MRDKVVATFPALLVLDRRHVRLGYTASRLEPRHVLALVGAVVSCRLVSFHAAPLYDDAFITFRFAANLAARRGFVYNPGAPWEPIASLTAPGYGLLLALAARLGISLPTAAYGSRSSATLCRRCSSCVGVTKAWHSRLRVDLPYSDREAFRSYLNKPTLISRSERSEASHGRSFQGASERSEASHATGARRRSGARESVWGVRGAKPPRVRKEELCRRVQPDESHRSRCARLPS